MSDANPLEVDGGGLPRNFLRPCLLLLLSEMPSHGYDLLERLGQLGLPAADPGGLYRVLRALEREEMVISRWETSEAGPAHLPPTREWLHAWAGALAEGRRIVTGFLDRYATVTTDPAQRGP